MVACARRAQGDREAPPQRLGRDLITGDYWAEGPSPLKLGDRWIVYFDRYREKRHGALVSRDLETWEDVSEHVHFPPGARHGTVFRVSQAILDRLLAVERG